MQSIAELKINSELRKELNYNIPRGSILPLRRDKNGGNVNNNKRIQLWNQLIK
jgi:hypothetical protein